MIGNDIIDLNNVRTGRKSENFRFLNKVFTDSEKTFITQSRDPETILWILWSMKEAVYKAHQRKFGLPRKFNPRSLECFKDLSTGIGTVKTREAVYSVQTEITSDYIHSITAEDEYFQRIYPTSSKAKTLVLEYCSSLFRLNKSDLKIAKDRNGIPSISHTGTAKNLPFSLSHHGNFTAFVIPLINS